MAVQKVYQIQINGLTESVKAVDALNESLKTLEASIKALEGATINVKASVPSSTSASGGYSKASSLSEEEKLQRQIEQLEEKRIAHSKEIYQNYLAAKDVLKETEQDQKQIAAAERMAADSYSNTIQGMKQELADIKSVMQTVDLGDTEQLDKMVKRANELNTELKKVEESYGQFGRNVGNYKSAADGFNKFKIEVGGVTREFNTAREAAKTLSNELLNLPKGAKGAEELRAALQQIKSEMQDINKSSVSMDKLLDTMEGFVAVANLGQGIRGLFGVNDAEIQKSIKNLVALQNVLKGIETINKQINTREGIGAWIAPFNANIDKATSRLLIFNRALLGTGKAAKTASVAIKAFSKALKVALSAGVLLAVDLLVEKLMDLVEGFKKVDEVAEREKETQKDISKAYAESSATLAKYQTIVKNFNGSKKEEENLVKQLNTELGNSLGTYKTLAQWMDVLTKKGESYIKMLTLQAKAQAAFNNYVKAMESEQKVKDMSIDEFESFWQKFLPSSWTADITNRARVSAIQAATSYTQTAKEELEKSQTEVDNFMKSNGIGDYSPQIEKNGKKTKSTVEKIQDEITKKEIEAMEEGLNKKLRQLDEEERQTINKLKQNGRATAAEIEKIQKAYSALREKEIKEYLVNLENTIKQSADNIEKIQFKINTDIIDNEIDRLQNRIDELAEKTPKNTEIAAKSDINVYLKRGYTYEETKQRFGGYQTRLSEFPNTPDVLKSTIDERLKLLENYYEEIVKIQIDSVKEQSQVNEAGIKEREAQDRQAEFNRQSTLKSNLEKTKKEIENSIKTIEEKYGEFQKSGVAEGAFYISDEKIRENYGKLKVDLDEVNAQIEEAQKQHKEKLLQISEATNNAIKKNELDTQKEISAIQEQYYSLQLDSLRDIQSKINEILSRQPITNNWGIVNLNETKKQLKEAERAVQATLQKIRMYKAQFDELFSDGFLTPSAYNAVLRQFNDAETAFGQMLDSIMNQSQQRIPQFVQSLQVYLGAAIDSFNQISQAVWNAQEEAFDDEQREIDEELDVIEEKLSKYEDILQEHKSNVDSIEDELATARGDRRQHLIDQLNAEMEAERAAAAEKKRLDKEKEAAERKQDELDKKRRKAQYHRDQIQAVVNGALAVTYASMNTWPIPAIPLMALAASTTAAQLAIMASNKPYAKGGQLDGGVAVGNRHRDGGIKVLGGRAEIEGGEFITNRLTTEKNINLLEYINSKKKRIDINDLVEFYSSGSVKKNIMKMSPKSKFADGGYIPPTLSTTIEIEDKLLDSFERYSNRPVVVSVVDITSKQDDVRRVQTLAGL